MLQEISDFDLNDMLKGFKLPSVDQAHEEYVTDYARQQYQEFKREHRKAYKKMLAKRAKQRKKHIIHMDYNDYHDPMLQQPADRNKNPYDYGSAPMTRHNEPQDKTNAAAEAAMIFEGEVDLFDKKLFPAQNRKSYSEKSGREFLADFTKATRGQLVVSMSRLAQENPREFAKLWIEMEKFNTPQQQAVDLNANIQAKAALYDQLDKLSEPEELSIPDELESPDYADDSDYTEDSQSTSSYDDTPYAEETSVPTHGEGFSSAEDYPPTTTDTDY